MRYLVACLVLTTLAVTYFEGAKGAGTSSKAERDVVTASVRVIRDGEAKALATLCTPLHALTIANEFIYTQVKMNTVNIYVVAEDFNGLNNCSRHLVNKIEHEDRKEIVVLAIIILTDKIDREDIFIPKIDKIHTYLSVKKNYYVPQYLGKHGTVVVNEEIVINERTQEKFDMLHKKFIPQKHPDRILKVLGDLYVTDFNNKELETGSEYMGGFLLVEHKGKNKLVGIVKDKRKFRNPNVIIFINLIEKSLFLVKHLCFNLASCKLM